MGFELIEKLQTDLGRYDLPIIIYTGKELTRKEELHLKKVADAIIVKEASSPERLLAETALFLHRVEADLPEPKRRMLERFHRSDPVLAGRKVLIVDDDVRNIFALTSALEAHNMEVIHAENGQEGIDLLQSTPGIDAVLMDIMMPEMDGYEAITAIRQMEEFKQLPGHCVNRKSDEGGSRSLSRGRRLRLHFEAAGYRPAALASQGLVIPAGRRRLSRYVTARAELEDIEIESASRWGLPCPRF